MSTSQGAAVLGLMERGRVPPLPAFYKLLFDYVSGVRGLVAERVGNILEDGQGAIHGRLYSEFVAPYENREPIEQAIAQMVARLVTLDHLIVESSEANRAQSDSLNEASIRFADGNLDVSLMRDWIDRLEANNQRLIRANAALVEELEDAQAELEETRAEIGRSRESSLRDPMTGIANRSGLDRVLTELVGGLGGKPLSCAVIDIDHFKTLNDTYGHQVGDKVLLVVTRAILSSARGTDIVGRTGGDEFAVVFPGTPLSAAHNVADGIRSTIGASDLTAALGDEVLGGITVSIGVAQFQPGESVARMFERADRCLYRAKNNGRNRVDSFAETDAVA